MRGIYKGPLPWEYVRWTVAVRTGWTLDYIDSLPLHELYAVVSIWSGENRGRAENAVIAKW